MKFLRSLFTTLGVLTFLGIVAIIILVITLSDQVQPLDQYKEKQDHIAIVSIEGPIMSEEPWMDYLEQVKKNSSCKGVIIRVNSPGGAVGSSQELYEQIKAINATVPVVVSFGNIAASGGYYLSLGARKIFSNPGTLTGSIGVIMEFPQIGELFKKWGIEMEVIKSGEFKDAGSMFRKLSENDQHYFQAVIDDAYTQFRGVVAKERKIEGSDLDSVCNGKVFTGQQACALHLVDTVGTLTDVKAYIRKIAKLGKDAPFIALPPKKNWLEKAIDSKFGVLQKTLEESPLFNLGVYYLLPGSLGI